MKRKPAYVTSHCRVGPRKRQEQKMVSMIGRVANIFFITFAKRWFKIPSLFLIAICAVFASGLLSLNQDASAATIILDGTSCPTYNGTWNGGTSTCTLSSGGGLVAASDELIVPSGTTLVANNPPRTTGIGVLRILTNDSGGQITILNSDFFSSGISLGDASGKFINNGSIAINSGGNGISYAGGISTFTNNGSITISNFRQNGINVGSRGSNFTNNGTITVSNTGGNGIGIVSFLTNNGTITVSNSGGAGILGGTITNNSGGKITVSNTGGFGIETGPSIVLTNNSGALIAVSNTGNIDNSGTINNTFGGTFT